MMFKNILAKDVSDSDPIETARKDVMSLPKPRGVAYGAGGAAKDGSGAPEASTGMSKI